MSQTIQTQRLDKRSLLQHMNSADMSQDLDPSFLYLANAPRQHQQLNMRPLFPRQHSLTAQTSNTANMSPSKSFETLSSANDDDRPERQYHHLPGNAPESPRSITMPNLFDQQQPPRAEIQSNTLPAALYPPFPPQPHPRTFTPMESKSQVSGSNPTLGHSLIPFANSSNIMPGPGFEKKGQSFSSFLEEKQYETLDEKSKQDDVPSSLVSFPPSKPNTISEDKIMNIGDDDTIVRHITVMKKKKRYPTKYIFFLYQIILIILLLAVAAVAVVALLEVKRLEGSAAVTAPEPEVTSPPPTSPPTSPPDDNNTLQLIMELEGLISTMNTTITELQDQVSLLTSQLTNSNTTLSERVLGVEESGSLLINQIQTLNSSLMQTANDSIGPCQHSQFTCSSGTGGLGCVPNTADREELMIRDGYELSSVWCEGSLADAMLNINLLADMNTYVRAFNTTPQAYQCGCNLPTPASEAMPFIFQCTTNIIQCRI